MKPSERPKQCDHSSLLFDLLAQAATLQTLQDTTFAVVREGYESKQVRNLCVYSWPGDRVSP